MLEGSILIREERPADHAAVRRINDIAFGQPQEGELVDALRANCPEVLSLVAEQDGVLLGHIMFSPCVLDPEGVAKAGMGLAPMAVLPAHQRRGIGSQLVAQGLATLRAADCAYVIVLGHPEYYPRFGFVPASRFGVRCIWEAGRGLHDPGTPGGCPGGRAGAGGVSGGVWRTLVCRWAVDSIGVWARIRLVARRDDRIENGPGAACAPGPS